MWLVHRSVREAIDETCTTDFVYLIIELFLVGASTYVFFFYRSMMYLALEQSSYGRTKLNKDNL